MSIFRKQKKANNIGKTDTIQSLQAEFNQVMFELGDLNYRKHMLNQELANIASEINTRIQKADELGKRASVVRQLAQEEVKKATTIVPEVKVDETVSTTS
jgi:uncharacterized coiled-coil DUF342 family protein